MCRVLRSISYLRDMPEHIILHVSLLMQLERKDANTEIMSFHPGVYNQAEVNMIEETKFGDDQFYIVYDGRIAVET